MMKKRIGQFLIDEIAKQGVDKIFGVPGDFNLTFLDDIEAHETLEWVGNTNELNASYARRRLCTFERTCGYGNNFWSR